MPVLSFHVSRFARSRRLWRWLLAVCALLWGGGWMVCAEAQSAGLDEILERVYSYKERLSLPEGSVCVRTYVRVHEEGERHSFWIRYVPRLSDLPKGASHSVAEIDLTNRIHPSGYIDSRFNAFYTTQSHYEIPTSRLMKRLALSLYSPVLFADHVLSPLNRRNRRYYSYRLVSRQKSDESAVVTLKVAPKYGTAQMVRGTFSIDEATGRVGQFDFSFYYDDMHMNLSGTMGAEGVASLYPDEVVFRTHINLMGNRLNSNYYAKLYEPRLDTADVSKENKAHNLAPRDVTRDYELRLDTAKVLKGRSFFDRSRPIALTAREAELYAQADSLELGQSSAKSQNQRRVVSLENLFLDSHRWNLGGDSRIKVPPILTPSMVQWSHSKGVSLSTKLWVDAKYRGGKTLRMRPRLAYNFKLREVYWKFPLEFVLNPRNNLRLSLEVGNANRTYDSGQADLARQRLEGITQYDSLLHVFDQFNFNYYHNLYARLEAAFSIVPGLDVRVGLHSDMRSLVGWNEAASQSGLTRWFRSLAPRFHAEWTPALLFYRDEGSVVPVGSSYPTFSVDYECGIKTGVFNQSYERFEFDVMKRFNLYALRAILLRAGAGWYTNTKGTYFRDYENFSDNNMPSNWDDDMSGQFQLLSSYWYNESRHYLRAMAAYESPLLFLSRLGLTSRYVQRERLYVNLLNVERLSCYTELGYGLSTHMFDIGLFTSLYNFGGVGFGVKIDLHLFDQW